MKWHWKIVVKFKEDQTEKSSETNENVLDSVAQIIMITITLIVLSAVHTESKFTLQHKSHMLGYSDADIVWGSNAEMRPIVTAVVWSIGHESCKSGWAY